MDKKHEIDAICATHRSEMARIASQHEHLRVTKDQYQSEHVAEMQKRAATIKVYEDKLHETYNRPMFELAEANKTRHIGLEFEPKLRDLRPLVLPPTPAREPSNSRPQSCRQDFQRQTKSRGIRGPQCYHQHHQRQRHNEAQHQLKPWKESHIEFLFLFLFVPCSFYLP